MQQTDPQLEAEFAILEDNLPEADLNHCLHMIGREEEPLQERSKMLHRVMNIMAKMDYLPLKMKIVRFGNDRRVVPAFQGVPIIPGKRDIDALCTALNGFSHLSQDTKICQAYLQMNMYCSIKKQLHLEKKQKRFSPFPSNRASQIVKGRAERCAGPVSEQEIKKTKEFFMSQYTMGHNWRRIVRKFGGQGIVFLFILAGNITPSYYTSISN